MQQFPAISVLFITYNRLVTLKPTLEAFLARTDYPRDRLELIVCDDCSPPAVQEELRLMPFDVHCLAAKRGGLGANANQGLKAASGDLILQMQDDWECLGPPGYLQHAASALESAPDVGMVILNQHPMPLPVRRRQAFDGGALRIYDNKPHVRVNMVAEHAYTDWPHLKRRAFHDTLGLYQEGTPMWEAELEFSRRVNAQTNSFIADVEGMNVFAHIGAEHSYNVSSKKLLAKKISRYPGGARAIEAYFGLKRFIKQKWPPA